MQSLTAGLTGADLVFGALGQWSQVELQRLRSAAPEALELVGEGSVCLWATTSVVHGPFAGGGYLWNPLVGDSIPKSWQQAAEDRLAAGLWHQPGWVLLHTCALGIQDIYIRRHDDAVYFSTRLSHLLTIGTTRVSVDWNAWAATIAFGSPLGDATPFGEIRRLASASALLVTTSTRKLTFEPRLFDIMPDQTSPPATTDVVARLSAVVDEQAGDGAVDLTLSGGWDSRLLASVAHNGRRVNAWTTSPDDGLDEDLQFSAPVAEALGIDHFVVVPETDAWVFHRLWAYQSFDYQSWLHTWLAPLAIQMRSRTLALVNGLGGDVLFKGLFVTREVAEAPTIETSRNLLFAGLTGGRALRDDCYSPEMLSWMTDTSREAFDRVTKAARGRPNELVLSVLLARLARPIASAPLRLFAGKRRLVLPFIDHGVMSLGLRIPMEAKLDGAYYLQLLGTAGGRQLTSLPSTNDKRLGPSPGPRRQTSPRATSTLADTVLGDELVTRMLSVELQQILADPHRAHQTLGKYPGMLQVVQGLGLLAQWRHDFADHLKDSILPWDSGSA